MLEVSRPDDDDASSDQVTVQFGCAVNADNKIGPDRIRRRRPAYANYL